MSKPEITSDTIPSGRPWDGILHLQFGLGLLGVGAGTYDGLPCLLVEPIEENKIGAKVARSNAGVVMPGSVILTFANEESLAVFVREVSKVTAAAPKALGGGVGIDGA